METACSSAPFLSIIIPIYNGIKSGLPKCLESIWNQPLDASKYEVICIDDCSKDDTWNYLLKQKELHANLQILRNECNVRQGASRNKGVNLSKGQYILFLDCDDYYHPNSLQTIYDRLIINDLEVLVSDSTYQFGNKENNQLQLNFKYKEITNGETFLKENGYACSPWRLAAKKDFLKKNNLFFVEGNRVEDIDWSLKVFYYVQKIQYMPFILVHYVMGDSGTTVTMYKNPRVIIDYIDAGKRTLELTNTLYNNSSVKDSITKIACSYFHNSVKSMFGIYTAINVKKGIINSIPDIPENDPLVKKVKQHPILFSLVTNLLMPFFRILKRIQLYRHLKN